jgi:hypothetical protein
VSGTLSAHLTSIFGGTTNGISLGTVTNPSAFGIDIDLVPGTNQRQAVDKVCLSHNAANWRIKPSTNGTLTLEAGLAQDLFGSAIQVVAAPGMAGRDIVTAVETLALQQETDLDDYANGVFVRTTNGAGGTGFTGVTSAYYTPEGATLTITRYVSTAEVDPANVVGYSQTLQAEATTVRRQITVDVGDADIGHLLETGENVGVYDPLVGLYFAGATTATRGTIISPLPVQCVGMTWPIREGMGVYYCWHGTSPATITDLTPWVVAESGPATLDIGATTRPALGLPIL